MLLVAVLYMFCSFTAEAFLVRPLATDFSKPQQLDLQKSMLTRRNYFDDVSRCAMDYEGEQELPWRSFLTNRTYAEEKCAALATMLTGYDDGSIAGESCTNQQIHQHMDLWADRSGVVGDAYGDELYESILGVAIGRSDSMIGCLALYWETIVDIIQQTLPEVGLRSQVFLLVFPDCRELYDYKRMTMLNAAVDFSKELCTYLGTKFTLALFHPSYKNAPRMMSPAYHAPFPTGGLHFMGTSHDNMWEQDHVIATTNTLPHHYNRYWDDTEYIPNLQERRRSLESLFQSTAASGSPDHHEAISPADVRQHMTEWMAADGAMWHPSDVGDRWTISNSTIGEEAYAGIWKAIYDLSLLGREADHVAWVQQQQQQSPILKSSPKQRVIRSMFVSTKFKRYSAETFKRFAITVNAVLKRITSGNISLELLHPEYMGLTEVESQGRRAPFPAIQICYKVQAIKKKEMLP